MPHAEIYIQISPNHFSVREVASGRVAEAQAPSAFTTSRLLIGNFALAQQILAPLVRSVASSWLRTRAIVMHPLAMTEGGLSPVEERLFTELAEACGAARVALWLGPPLTDAEVTAKLRE